MKKQIIGGFAVILVLTIIMSPIQTIDAISYTGHDGSVSKDLEKTLVKPYGNKKDYWSYIVMVCPATHSIAIAEVILKSDTEQVVLGANKIVKQGECSHYGAVMKAKDANTLGAQLVTKGEAIEKMIQILKDNKNTSGMQRDNMMAEFMRLYIVTGFLPRL